MWTEVVSYLMSISNNDGQQKSEGLPISNSTPTTSTWGVSMNSLSLTNAPSIPAPTPLNSFLSTESTTKEKMIEILTAYYSTHSPEKLEMIPQIILKYSGQFDMLLQKLSAKYGAIPSPISTTTVQVSSSTKFVDQTQSTDPSFQVNNTLSDRTSSSSSSSSSFSNSRVTEVSVWLQDHQFDNLCNYFKTHGATRLREFRDFFASYDINELCDEFPELTKLLLFTIKSLLTSLSDDDINSYTSKVVSATSRR